MPRFLSVLLCLLLLCPATVMAGEAYVDIEKRLTPEQLRETGLDTLSPTQLARLNQLLRGQAVVAAPPPASAPAAQPALAQFIGMDGQPIRSRLKVDMQGWRPGAVFELENGQRWQVLKGKVERYRAAAGHAVSVVPGLAGRWFLRMDEDLPAARVVRIE